MVSKLGMSELGNIAYNEENNKKYYSDYTNTVNYFNYSKLIWKLKELLMKLLK